MGAIVIVLRLLDILVATTGALPQIAALRAKLKLMHAEGREPTDEEWAELFADIEFDTARLDAADKRLNS